MAQGSDMLDVCTDAYGTEEAPDHANGICVGPTDPREHHRFGDLATGCKKSRI